MPDMPDARASRAGPRRWYLLCLLRHRPTTAESRERPRKAGPRARVGRAPFERTCATRAPPPAGRSRVQRPARGVAGPPPTPPTSAPSPRGRGHADAPAAGMHVETAYVTMFPNGPIYSKRRSKISEGAVTDLLHPHSPAP